MRTNILSNGVQIPDLCCGTGLISTEAEKPSLKYYASGICNKEKRKKIRIDKSLPGMVDAAMHNGCNMFDTSRAYGGAEVVLGRSLKKYRREDYFITTKLSNYGQYNGDIRGALKSSLRRLGMEYVDLYLIHWPVDDIYIDSWKQMEQLYKEGLCRAIGVSNFNIHHIEKLREKLEIMPMVNEIECHPLFTQNSLRDYCAENGIKIMAYTSTARMDERLYHTCLPLIASKYSKTVAQVILRWHQQIGNIPIVNSTNVKHVKENTEIYDFTLSESELESISGININSRLRYDPDNCDFRQL